MSLIICRAFLRLFVTGLVLTGLTAAAGPLTFSLDPPSGIESGLPGTDVGWGFSITNTTGFFVVIANSYFCESGATPPYTTCAPALGSYQDFSHNDPFIGSSGESEPFSSGSQTGAGEYSISAGDTSGEVDSGTIVLVYDEYTCDPRTICDPSQNGGDMYASADAELDVTGAESSIPEPGPLFSVASALALLIATRAVRKSSTIS